MSRLGASYAIRPGNGVGLLYTPDTHGAQTHIVDEHNVWRSG